MSQGDVDRVLAGKASYDALDDRDQAAVRAAWSAGVTADLAALNLRAQFEVEGRARWSEVDPDGTVTVRGDLTARSSSIS